ncbi:response regulator [Chelatococcus sp. GCM10030263]|uniref:response regulator n=1 Tax=Chelatococcus sp. GCM10030263 TaxID=3273387 RepID=UPI0036245C8F
MPDFSGLRVLLVEDEAAVALLLEDMLEELGCEVAASVARLSKGFDAVEKGQFHLAVLDVNVNGEQVFPLARLLSERGIPFVFSTGYGAAALPADLANRPVVPKPFSISDLRRSIAAAFDEQPACGGDARASGNHLKGDVHGPPG